jgi:hypothetical protein
VPVRSTVSKNRHGRFRGSDLIREVFETTVRRRLAERLVGGEGFAVDASMIKADANRRRGVLGSEGLPPEAANHAVREYLSVLDERSAGQRRSCRSLMPTFERNDEQRRLLRAIAAFVESTINEIVARRMIKKQQMRWNGWTAQPSSTSVSLS